MTSPIILQPHQIIKLEERGRKEIFNPEKLDILCSYTITVKIITQKSLAQKFSCSQPTICRVLQKLEITYKKISYQSSEQLRKKNKEKINFFISEIIPTLPQSNFFFLDECSFHLNSAPRRGYYWKTSRLVSQRPGDKGKNQSLILLTQITKGEKIIHKRLIEGGMKTQAFHDFLTEFNPPSNGKKNYLIMDNLSVHKAKKSCIDLGLPTIEELLISKNIEPIYLPSYTPELNPVEKMFNITRQHVESEQPRKKAELELVIERKIDFFRGENLIKYFENSIKECLMKNSKISNEPVPERFEKWKK
ncbi:7413_t:CDS:2 [Entrophospora sp. SA101]|nr:7413_t:CDS:2 [Entrophospora sp. SA101]